MAGWTIEAAVPAFLGLLRGAIKVLNSVIDALKPLAEWLFDNFLKPVAEWTGGVIVTVLETLADALDGISAWISENQTAFQVMTGIVATFIAVWETANFATFMINIGGVAGMISKLNTLIRTGIILKIKDKAAALSLAAGHIKDLAVSLASTIANLAKEAAAWTASTAAKAANAIAQGASTAATLAWNAACTVATAVTTAFGAAINFLTSPIGMVVVAIGALIAIGVLLYQHWEEVKEFAAEVWESIKETLYSFFEAWEIGWESIKQFCADIWQGIKDIFSAVGEWFTEIFQAAWDGIVSVWNAVTGWFSDLWTGIKDVFSAVGSWFGEKFTSAWTNIKSAFSATAQFFKDLWTEIKKPFLKVADWFKNTFSKAWQAVKDVFSAGGKIFDGIKEGISGVFTSVVNKLIDGINVIISKPLEFLNGVLNDIRDIEILGATPFDEFWGYDPIPVPQIPKLATGTVVPANYGEFMAILGDNKRETEVVSPLSTMKQALLEALVAYGGTGGNGQKISVTIPISLNGKVISQLVIDDINDFIKRNGRSPIKI